MWPVMARSCHRLRRAAALVHPGRATMGESPTAPDKPPANGAGVKAGDILGLALRVAPWLAMAGVAAFWRRDRRRWRPKAEPNLAPETFDVIEPHRGRMTNF